MEDANACAAPGKVGAKVRGQGLPGDLLDAIDGIAERCPGLQIERYRNRRQLPGVIDHQRAQILCKLRYRGLSGTNWPLLERM